MRKNIEIIILLGIIFFIFTTLVIFYEDKIDSMYYDNSNNYILLELKVNDLLDDNIAYIENDYVKLDDEIYSRLKKDLMYTFKFKTSKDKILKGDLNKLFNSYKIEEIHYGIYK